jgi:ribonuclease E
MQQEEIRVALTENKHLLDFDIETLSTQMNKANIYKAKISRVEPSLNAVFVEYSGEKNGFLPAKDIAPEYFGKKKPGDMSGLKEGQELIVQVDKDERGNKGAALNTFITLAGCYLVLMPNNPAAGGISRRIEGEERQALRAALDKVTLPSSMGMIVRTAGVGRTQEELQWDVDALLKLWDAIKAAADAQKAPFLIYQESDVILRSVRDYLRQDIEEIAVDTQEGYDKVMKHVQRLRPDFADRVTFYQKDEPIFHHYAIEKQIETAHVREVKLPSGGAIVIDHTEALTSIDINSARSTRGSNIEDTAFNTNMEASSEIMRQLKIRDMGGLVVIDFIDMSSNTNQRKVEDKLFEMAGQDRARIQIGRISRFGLLEMSRQRLRSSLAEASHIVCPRCEGQGTIRDIHSLTLSIVRMLRSEAFQANPTEIHVKAPIDVATYLLNEKRAMLQDIETKTGVRIAIIPCAHLETPHYEVKRLKKAVRTSTYQMAEAPTTEQVPFAQIDDAARPAVQGISFAAAPTRTEPKRGLITRLWDSLFGDESATPTPTPHVRDNNPQNSRSAQNRNDRNRGRQRRNPRGGRGGSSDNTRSSDSSDNTRSNDNRSSSNSDNTRSHTDSNRNTNNNRNRSRNNNARTERSPEQHAEQSEHQAQMNSDTPHQQHDDSATKPQSSNNRRGGRGRGRGRNKPSEAESLASEVLNNTTSTQAVAPQSTPDQATTERPKTEKPTAVKAPAKEAPATTAEAPKAPVKTETAAVAKPKAPVKTKTVDIKTPKAPVKKAAPKKDMVKEILAKESKLSKSSATQTQSKTTSKTTATLVKEEVVDEVKAKPKKVASKKPAVKLQAVESKAKATVQKTLKSDIEEI